MPEINKPDYDRTATVKHGISVIVVTSNSAKFILLCLNSIFKQGRKVLEVILIDNCSKDGTIAAVREHFPGVSIVENPVNLGAAEARNQGIKLAKGEWVLTLDCDTVLEEDFFSSVTKVIGSLPSEVGMLQPKILNPDKRTIYSCGISLTWSRRYYDVGSRKFDSGQFDGLKEVFGPCCAAALYRRKMLEELKGPAGYFDNRFFFLVEDVDLSWRARKHYWKCLFIPEAVCYHRGNSSAFGLETRQFLNFRNRYLMIKKNEGILPYVGKILPFVLYDLPRLFYSIISNCHLRRWLFKSKCAREKGFI